MFEPITSQRLNVLPGNDTGAIIEVAGVGEGGQRAHGVVAGELGQTLHEIIQLVHVPAFLWAQQTQQSQDPVSGQPPGPVPGPGPDPVPVPVPVHCSSP